MYDFDFGALFNQIKKKGHKKILLQLPLGLKTSANSISDSFSEAGFAPIISIDPCYGACDRIETTIADAVVQFGHTEIPISTKTPTFFFSVKIDRDPLPILADAIPLLKGKTAVVTTSQHLHTLEPVVQALKEAGIDAVIPEGTERAKKGQVLGCAFPKGNFDCYLYIGTGYFHPMGLSASTRKPVIILDPVSKTVKDPEQFSTRFLSKRAAAIEKAKDAKAFGILVSTKKGQDRMALAEKLMKELPGKSYLLVGNELTPENLLGLKVDCLVNTACPRIIEDHFHVPIISPTEVEILLGKREWDDYKFDEIG